MFENKKIFIFGLARSGYEAAKLLSKYNNEIIVCDKTDEDKEKINELKDLNIKFIKTDTPEDYLDSSFDYVIKNPGISNEHNCIKKACDLNIDVINEVEVGYNFIKDKVKIIGITGSNGKTTTTTMIYEVMKKAGLPVILAGNIGYPLCSIVNEVKENDIIVMEVSDHQLLNVKDFKTDISILTNLSEVHLDFHGDYNNYKNVKKKIFNYHTKDNIAIINIGNEDVVNLTKDINSTIISFSSKNIADIYLEEKIIKYKEDEVININNVKIKGVHNYENIMCLIAIQKIFNISNNIIKEYLNTFGGVEHRIEFVKEVNGRLFYNDSKATNTESTIVALKSFDNNIILLLGGLDRGHSFEPLNPYLKNVKSIICYGETKERINLWCNEQNIPCFVFDTLEQSTKKAYEISEKEDVILLSPSCASWDQYKCMEDRGNEFKKVINELK